MNLLIYLGELAAVFLFPLGQLGRISYANQQVSIYPYEAAMGITLFFLFARYRLAPINKSPFRLSVLLFLVSLAVSFLLTFSSYSAYDNTVGFLYLVRLFFYIFHFMYLGYHALKTKPFRKSLRIELVAIAAVIIATSWLQYLFYPNLRPLLYQGWDPHLYRVFSFFFEPYLAGGALGLSLLFLYFRWEAKGKEIYFKWGVLFVLFVLVMLTFSRTVYVATLATVGLLLLRTRRPALIGALLGIFVLLAIVIPKPQGVGVQLFRAFSVETRVGNAAEGIGVWMKQPLFGVGYNRIRYKKAELGLASEYGSSHAAANYHSSFVTMLAAGGIFGLVCFGLFLGKLMKVSTASFYYVFFLSVISLGDNALLHPFMLFLLLRLVILEMDQSSLV